MIDINQAMQRDQTLQYLAFYTATKGLMIALDFEQMQKFFVEYKKHIMKGEYSLEWLVEQVMMKYGVPPDQPNKEAMKGLVVVPVEVMNTLMGGFDPRLSQQKPQHDKTITSTIDPEVSDLGIVNMMKDKLEQIRQKHNIQVPPVPGASQEHPQRRRVRPKKNLQ